jgi:uncharacterized protein YodC (DUF2158 family)
MPLMVGNIVVLNSGSSPMTVKAITHAGQVLCQWIDAGGVLHEMEFAPEMLSDDYQAPRPKKGARHMTAKIIDFNERANDLHLPAWLWLDAPDPLSGLPSGALKH